MMTQWIKVTAGVGMLIGVLAACSDSETADGSGGSTTTANGGSGNSMTTANGGSGATGGTTSNGGSGGTPNTVNGCTRGSAVDRTGEASVTINDVAAWDFGHAACIVVDAGSDVVWQGDFTLHPLRGGESPTEDSSSPISGNTPANNEVTITFANAGDFPYHCGNHSTMQGVVYVE